MERSSGNVSSRFRRLLPDGGLWDNADFLRLWGAESASLFGTEITALAFPLLAIAALDASAREMGYLAAAGTAPFFLWSLFAGVWVDRRKRRPILVTADLLRVGLILSVPIAAWAGALRIEQMYVIAFLAGTLGVFFEVAHFAYVPALVGRQQVVDANSKLQISHSAANSGGPGVAGLIVQALSAPVALVVDAISFLVSALLLRGIQAQEPPVARSEETSIREDIVAGLRMLLGHPLLRPIVLGAVVYSIFQKAIVALYVLYATEELGLAPVTLGLILAVGGVGAIPGALLSARVAGRLGVGPTIIVFWFLQGATWLLVPLTTGAFVVLVLAAQSLLYGVVGTIVNIQQWSLRQIVTPDELQGRVTAGHRFLVFGAFPVGALLGGTLGSLIGLRETLAICAVALVCSTAVVLFSPLRGLREAPEPVS